MAQGRSPRPPELLRRTGESGVLQRLPKRDLPRLVQCLTEEKPESAQEAELEPNAGSDSTMDTECTSAASLPHAPQTCLNV